MEVIGDVSIEAVAEGDEFEGWLEFILRVETDEDGFETCTYEKVSDTLYTTEELLEKTFAEEEMVYAAMISIEKPDAEFANRTVYMGDSINWISEASAEDGEMSLETTIGYEGFEYVILGNGTLYMESVTTEELCELAWDGVTNYYAVANWN